MAKNDEVQLDRGWRILMDFGSNPAWEETCFIGQFNTVFKFWSYWNTFSIKYPLDKLPRTVNIRFLRETISMKYHNFASVNEYDC